jgi:hypothetical protein
MTIVKAENFDLSKVSFSDVKVDQHGRKMVYINGEHGKILVQTPKMYAPNGIKRWRKKDAVDNKEDKFEMELSFYGEDANPQLAEFHEKWNEFDELIKEQIMSKSKEWLGKSKVSMEVVEDKYLPMVKIPMKDGEVLPYPSRIRVKLDREQDADGNFSGRFLSNKRFKSEVLLFDENKQPLQLRENNAEMVVSKGSQVVCILECVYISIATNISVKWKLVQAKVFQRSNSITEYAMLDDDPVSATVDHVTTTLSKTSLPADLDSDGGEVEEEHEVVEDSHEVEEDSDNEVEEDVLEPEPVPVVKKTPTRTKRGVTAVAVA